MQITVDAKKFTGIVNSVVGVFQRSAMLSATGNELLISTVKGEQAITIESANQGMYVKAKMPAVVATAGEVVVNSNYVMGLKFRGKDVIFTYTGDKKNPRVNFECDKFVGQLDASQNVSKIADQRPQEVKTDVVLPFEPFKKGMGLVSFTPNKTTPVLPLNIICSKDGLVLSTYDSTSATYYMAKAKDLEAIDVLVPASFIEAAFDKLGDHIQFGMNAKLMKLSGDYFEIYHPTKQKFQKFDVVAYYDALQKKKPVLVFKCKAMAWLEALQTTSSLTTGVGISDNSIKVTINPKTKTAAVELMASIGEAASEFELIEVVQADTKACMISSLIFADFLAHVREDDITVSLFTDDSFKRVLIETNDVSYLLPIAQS